MEAENWFHLSSQGKQTGSTSAGFTSVTHLQTNRVCVHARVCVCSTCTCADEELGLSNTQFHFVQGYGHLQGGCNGEKEADRKRARFIIVVLIGNTKSNNGGMWSCKIAFKMLLLC